MLPHVKSILFFFALSVPFLLAFELSCSRHPELELLHCELTENTSNGSTPIITGLQGENDKNFNFSAESAVELSYRRLGEFMPLGLGRVFPGLRSFDLSSSSVAFVERKCFEGMHKLKDLRLVHNVIETLPIDAFADLTHLVILNLANNNIRELTPGLFDRNSELTILRLNDNQLQEIGSEIFRQNLLLRELSLQRNMIRRVMFDFTTLGSLESLDLTGNAGSCNTRFDKMSMGSGFNISRVQHEVEMACYQSN